MQSYFCAMPFLLVTCKICMFNLIVAFINCYVTLHPDSGSLSVVKVKDKSGTKSHRNIAQRLLAPLKISSTKHVQGKAHILSIKLLCQNCNYSFVAEVFHNILSHLVLPIPAEYLKHWQDTKFFKTCYMNI